MAEKVVRITRVEEIARANPGKIAISRPDAVESRKAQGYDIYKDADGDSITLEDGCVVMTKPEPASDPVEPEYVPAAKVKKGNSK